MHTAWSSSVTIINLQTGVGEVEKLQPVFAVGGYRVLVVTMCGWVYHRCQFIGGRIRCNGSHGMVFSTDNSEAMFRKRSCPYSSFDCTWIVG